MAPPQQPPAQTGIPEWDTAKPYTGPTTSTPTPTPGATPSTAQPSVALPAEWQTARPFFPDPSTGTPAPPLDPTPSPTLRVIRDLVIPIGAEVAGAYLGIKPLASTIKGARNLNLFREALPAGVRGSLTERTISRALPHTITGVGAGGGAAAGHVVGQTLLSDGPPPKPADLARSTAGAAAGGFFGEAALTPAMGAVGHSIRKGFSHLLPVSARTITRLTRNNLKPATADTASGQEALDFLGGKGPPGKITDSGFVQLMDNMARVLPGAARNMRQVAAEAEQEFTSKMDEVIARFGPRASGEEAGAALREGLVNQTSARVIDETRAAAQRGQQVIGEAETAMAQAARARLRAGSRAEQALHRLDLAFGPPMGKEATGRFSQELVEGAHDAADKAQSALYNDLWGETVQQRVDLSQLVIRARQLADETGRLGWQTGIEGRASRPITALTKPPEIPEGLAADRAALRTALKLADGPPTISSRSGAPIAIETLGKDARNAIAKMNPADPRRFRLEQELATIEAQIAEAAEKDLALTPQQVHRLRSFYGRMGRVTEGQEAGTFKQLFKAADETLAQALTPEQLAQYRRGAELHTAMIETFKEGALAKAVEAHPTAALRTMLGPSGAVRDVNMVWDILGPERRKPVQAQVLFEMTHTPSGRLFTPKELLTELEQWHPEELTAVFAGADDEVRGFAREMAQVTRAEAAEKATRETSEAAITAANRATEAARTAGTAAVTKAQEESIEGLVLRTLDKAASPDVAKLKAFTGPEGWERVRSFYTQALASASKPITGATTTGTLKSGKSFIDALPSREKLIEIYDEPTANWFYQYGRVRKLYDKKEAGFGSVAAQLMAPGAIMTLLSGAAAVGSAGYFGNLSAATGTALALMTTPFIFSHVVKSPRFRAMLLDGTQALVRGEVGRANRVTSQLIAQLGKAGILSQAGPPGLGEVRAPETAGRGGGPGGNTGQGGEAGRGQGPAPLTLPAPAPLTAPSRAGGPPPLSAIPPPAAPPPSPR